MIAAVKMICKKNPRDNQGMFVLIYWEKGKQKEKVRYKGETKREGDTDTEGNKELFI